MAMRLAPPRVKITSSGVGPTAPTSDMCAEISPIHQTRVATVSVTVGTTDYSTMQVIDPVTPRVSGVKRTSGSGVSKKNAFT